MIDTAEQERKLQQDAANVLNVSPESLDPEHNSILYKIRKYAQDLTGEIAHIAGAPLDEIARGEASHIGFQKAKSWCQRLMERVRGKTPLRQPA